MGALTAMVFKEGFLTTPFTECRECPDTRAYRERLSGSVHRGCRGAYILKEELSRSVHCGCTGIHILGETRKKRRDFCSCSFPSTVCESVHA